MRRSGWAQAWASSRRMVPATPFSSAKVSVAITAGTGPGAAGRGPKNSRPTASAKRTSPAE